MADDTTPGELDSDPAPTIEEAERLAALIPVDREHHVVELGPTDWLDEWPEPATPEEVERVFGPNAGPLPVLEEEPDPLDFDAP